MNDKVGKLLVVESDDALRARIVAVLNDGGYEVSTEYREGMNTDAQTTSVGSGGPLFNNQGKVIGINFAMVRDFGGSNLAIPIGYAESLLKP